MNHNDKFERFSGNTIVQQGLKEKSVRAALFMATGQGADFFLRIISTVILARLLIPEYFGLVAMVMAVTGIAEVIRDLGLSTATIQRNDINHAQVSNLFWVNLTAGILFFLFFTAISVPIAQFYNDQRLIPVTIALSTNFIWSGSIVQHQALLSRQLKQGQMSMILLTANLISILAAILLAIGNYQYWALVWREVVRNFLITGGVWIFCPWKPGFPRRNAGTRELLRFGRDLSVTHFLIGVISRIDGLLIGKYFGAAILGVYRQAYQLMMVPIEQINGPILSVAQPGLSRLQSDPERYRRYYQKILFFVGIITIPLGIFVAVYAREIILLLLGAKWIEATSFLRIFAIAAVIRPAVGTSAVVLITCGKSKKYLLLALVHSIVLTIFMIIGLHWGAIGIAIAHVSTTIVLMIPKLYYSYSGTPVMIGDFFKATRSPFIAGMGMLLILWIFQKCFFITDPFLAFTIGGVAGTFMYLTILFILPKGREDLVELYKDIMSSIRRKGFSKDISKLSVA